MCSRRTTAITWEIALSRIWDAIKQAEQQRSRATPRDTATNLVNDNKQDLTDRRKGLRHAHNARVLVYGSNGSLQPFHEETETIDANDEGCLLTLELIVELGQRLILTNMNNQAEQECRVVHVGKRMHGKARVNLTFDTAAPNFWRRS